jgi:MFS family permease
MTAHVSRRGDRPTRPGLRRVLISSYLGTAIEYYDFLVYGAAASVVFNQVFFSDLPALTGTIVSFATLAVGYVARPVGGVIFGHFGDRAGRKTMLVLSMTLMGVASMLIGLIPARETIGVLAPVLLVLLRLVQGIAVGGEWGGASLMAVEHAGNRGRGFAAAVANAGAPTGALLAALVLGLFSLMPEEAFLAWGWRIPFLLSGVLLIIGLWVRLKVAESPVFAEVQRRRARDGGPQHSPFVAVLRRPRTVVIVGLVVLAPMVVQSLLATVGLTLGIEGGLSRSSALLVQSLAAVVNIVTLIGFGMLSDRWGRRPILTFGTIAGFVLIYPVLQCLASGSVPLVLLGFVLGYGVVVASLLGVASSFITEQFSAEARFTGASLGYQLSSTLGAGFTPLIAGLLLAGSGSQGLAAVAVFVGSVCLVSLIAVRVSAESYRTPIIERDRVNAPIPDREQS